MMLALGVLAMGQGELTDSGSVVLRIDAKMAVETTRLPAEPVNLGYPHGPKTSEFVPEGAVRETSMARVGPGQASGQVIASADSFLVDTNPSHALGSQFGPVVGGRFNGIYDRKGDWLLSFEGGEVSIRPSKGGYSVSLHGPTVVKLRHRYVRNHLGYFLWEPKALWKQPASGWCSWMAHLQGVTESDVLDAATFFGANLKEYGYDVIQIDDGYQRASQSGEPPLAPGESEASLWTKPNAKFPSGLESVAHKITAAGLTPGIWVGLFLPLGLKNADGYVLGADQKPLKGPWVNYAVNGLNRKALDEGYLQTVRDLYQQGWRYFKIDTLRHVIYDNYRKAPAYWKARGQSPEKAFRAVLSGIRGQIGKDSYLLACWGSLPELAGIPDGCRIGEDVGPDFASMRRSAKYIAQFHHLNNVVWRNDPDYMCLRLPIVEAKSWVTLTALAGGHLMVSDPVKDYDPARLRLMRRVGPAMPLRPVNVAPYGPDPEWMSLDAAKDGEQWKIVSRFAWKDEPAEAIALNEFGLMPDKRYLAFDFWNSEFLGEVTGNCSFRSLKEGDCQVVSLRENLGRPQVLGTNRHLGQGVVELKDVAWDGSTLAGKMLLGNGENWSLFVHVPAGWKVDASAPEGAKWSLDGQVGRLDFEQGSGWKLWKVRFKKG